MNLDRNMLPNASETKEKYRFIAEVGGGSGTNRELVSFASARPLDVG